MDLMAGRYASLHFQRQILLFPGWQAKMLVTSDQLHQHAGVFCVAYQNRWVPACGLDSYLRVVTPLQPFLLVLEMDNRCLALACEQVKWLELTEIPQSIPSVLQWRGCPIAAIARDPLASSAKPLWVSHLKHLWYSLDIQLETMHEAERLAG